ncbi:hypothetical protein IKF84_02995 [Candidatus Saccharibacteria bacterium]|nr:hypothetical protein [Candidatus Saccharibacteria bacterium]
MVNSRLYDSVKGVQKELDNMITEYEIAVEYSNRSGISIREICSDEELKTMEATAHSAIDKLRGIDEEYRLRAIVLHNSITTVLNQ